MLDRTSCDRHEKSGHRYDEGGICQRRSNRFGFKAAVFATVLAYLVLFIEMMS